VRKRCKNTKHGVLSLRNSPRRAVLLAMASSHRQHSRLARLPLAWQFVTEVSNSALGKNPIFAPKSQFLIPQCPNWFPKFIQTFIDIKRHSKPYETWIKNIISIQITISPIFHKTLEYNSNFITIFITMNTHNMISQQQQLITITTPTNHKFIKESTTTTTSYITNFEQNTKFSWIYNLSMQFHHQQHNYQHTQTIHQFKSTNFQHIIHNWSLFMNKHLWVKRKKKLFKGLRMKTSPLTLNLHNSKLVSHFSYNPLNL